jgi:copper chaperone CopZ
MTRSILVAIMIAFLSVQAAFAAPVTASAKINGLVCDFCARAMEKTFGTREEVSNISVNLDTKLVNITFKDGKNIDDATITNLITEAGYGVVAITRSDAGGK